MRRIRGGDSWKVAAAIAVALGVGFSVLLISVSYGVSHKINAQLASPTLKHAGIVNVGLVNQILFLLTVVVTAGMLIQTSAATFTLGTTVMNTRREEVALRRQSGVLRSTLLWEFLCGVLGPCMIGGIVGEAIGIGVAETLTHATVLPIELNGVSLLAAFPVTILLSIGATLAPAWRFANASPAMLRRG
jgi:ABC-type lipoprotein release transport system permease subunit